MTYNRERSLKRLIDSLKKAMGGHRADLLVSLEFGANANTREYLSQLNWPFGEFTVVENPTKLGVHQHLLHCLNRAKDYNEVLFLEDDLFVVEGLMDYIEYGRSAIAEHPEIGAIGMHHYEMMQDQLLPFLPLSNGSPAYLLQKACANGFWMNQEQFVAINHWIDQYSRAKIDVPAPAYLHKWTDEKWETLFTKYLIDQHKFVLYPRASFVTDYAEKGENYHNDSQQYAAQTPLHFGDTKAYEWKTGTELVPYDAWYEVSSDFLKKHQDKLKEYTFSTDLHAQKDLNQVTDKLILTTRNIEKNKAILSFDNSLKPLENNVLQNVSGPGIALAKVKHVLPESSVDALVNHYEKQMYYNSKHSVVLGFKNTIAKWIKKIRS